MIYLSNHILWKTSWLTGLSSMYAFCKQQNTTGIILGNVFLTSVNFWKYPTLSWRRTMDIWMVRTCLLYQIHRSNTNQYGNIWMFLTSISITSYLRGCAEYRKLKYWTSTYNHMGLHVISNIANMILIAGE